MSENNNFCIIDIGTNAVKCKLFSNGNYTTPFNKLLTNSGRDDLNKEEVVSHVLEYMQLAEENDIDKKQIYICATEAFRTSGNRREIVAEIMAKTGRRVHIISPKREAYLSVIGGLREIPAGKLNAKNVLYIESGGGSTEISLVDMSGKQPDIIATTSLPLGSKRCKGNDAAYAEHIRDFIGQIKDKNFQIDTSLACVVNSGTASRVIARRYNTEQFKAMTVMKKQQHMSVKNFCDNLDILLEKREEFTPEMLAQYWIAPGREEGFFGHAEILSKVFSELKKQHFPAPLNNVPVSTTIGGLKDGLGYKIEDLNAKTTEEAENKLLTVYEDEQPPLSQQDKIKEIKEKISDDKHWIDEYSQFYADKNRDYKCEKSENYLTVNDENNNRVIYQSKNVVVIRQSTEAKDNKIYEDMIENSKKNGRNFVEFKDNTGLELKLRIYSACLKYGVKTTNFDFAPEMLNNVSETVAEIVNRALQNEHSRKTHIPANARGDSAHSA